MNRTLWIVQGLLTVVFLLAGGSKLVSPSDVLATQYPPPPSFVRFIGAAEILGALGLILPGVLRVRTGLTPLATAGLVVVMTGAAMSWLVAGSVAMALSPLILALLLAFVAYSRWVLARDHISSRHPASVSGKRVAHQTRPHVQHVQHVQHVFARNRGTTPSGAPVSRNIMQA